MKRKLRIRFLKSKNLPIWINPYKVAEMAYLMREGESFYISGKRISEQIVQVDDIEEIGMPGIQMNRWVELKYTNQDQAKKIIYIICNEWRGFAKLFSTNRNIEVLNFLVEI